MENYEKKYKEALRKATKIHRDDNEEIKHYMEVLFPELAESKDERIREKLIENFKWFCGDYPNTTKWGKDDDMLVKDILIWLEKQGENKFGQREECLDCQFNYSGECKGSCALQKSDLSEDEKLTDDCNFQYITDMIERYSKYGWDDEFSNDILNWFKSLKNRIK